MNVAIIGAGFSGLSLAYNFLKLKFKVTVFDAGSCASKVAAGLLHPYPGEKAIRSYRANEALETSLELIREVEAKTGVCILLNEGLIRQPINEVQKQNLQHACNEYKDVEKLPCGKYKIKSGYSVDTKAYLDALLTLCKKEETFTYYEQKVEILDELRDYDHVILACGYGIERFKELLPCRLKFTKGQLLLLEGSARQIPFELPHIAKGYVSFRKDKEEIILGSTYEKQFVDDKIDMETAKKELLPRITNYFSFLENNKIIGALSGVRVAHPNRNTPQMGRIKETLWIITAMGSKGLLYHAMCAKMLSQAVAINDDSGIEESFKIS